MTHYPLPITHYRILSHPSRTLPLMSTDPIVIDCDTCVMRHTAACDDCVVSVMLAGAPRLESDERRALEVLAEAGLVPRLRLVPRDGGLREAG